MKAALVTGASSGIGEATALLLARRGFDLGLGYRSDADGAKRVAAEVEAAGRRAVLFRLDHADPAAAAAAVDEAAENLGGVDAFVNNAGINHRAEFLDETLDDWRRMLDVDLTGPFACAQAAARRMVARGRGGRIVNVSSVHDEIPIWGGSAYCAAKGGFTMLTKVMALELARHGITVNAVSPGETATPMNGVPVGTDAGDLPRPSIPVGRPARAREVAALIAYLLEPDAAYLTGQSLTIDGGLMLMGAIPNQKDGGGLQ
ncbi:SDR family oxidoreductase [Amycolatopsis anabasis]|uniref:SDR family oxidoreductase n=1 Tax=Amycolatopsis anabasis TaxID=1840409 RepID=UPI00131AABA1|nr:SDR family oxidoreductase [Amycolatopsis anabasis]